MSRVPIFKKNLLTYEQVCDAVIYSVPAHRHPSEADVVPDLCSAMSMEKPLKSLSEEAFPSKAVTG